ncbi:MAG: hypothetical protein PHQ52_02215 [Candidatus Omnitrophica bacterium]|nr:hypothetical protein [Candidatus Omnitrophota bacterium]
MIKKLYFVIICIFLFDFDIATAQDLELYDKGTEKSVSYEKYGEFLNVGTYEYSYNITDEKGLSMAQGEGIDPNKSFLNDPEYLKLASEKKISKDIWSRVNTNEPIIDFYSWVAYDKIEPGIRLYFTGQALENAGLWLHAVKAYRASMIMYPNTFCWNRSHSWTWLIAPASWSKIINITRMHPELELRLDGAFIKTEAAIKGKPEKNKVSVTPGKFVKFTLEDRAKEACDITKLKVVQRRGGKVSCVKYSNGQWSLEVDNKPYFIKGIHYAPTKIGERYDWEWMRSDINNNGVNDVAYESWVDKNNNGKQDPDEEKTGDFTLLKQMGCNTLRILDNQYIDKKLLRDLNDTYGIKVLLCNFLGAYTVDSGATWEKGTDYTSVKQKKKMLAKLRNTVEEYKDEPWLLGYILGNENNLPADYTGINATRTNAASKPEHYAKFLNAAAKMIHEIDPEHPVGVGNFGIGLIDYYAQYATELDFIGINDYRGEDGFGSLWIEAKTHIDRPILITEFGCDAYWTGKSSDYKMQLTYIKNCWDDIVYNSAGRSGEGNSIGGIVFEWLDEWWKDQYASPYSHDDRPTGEMAFVDGWSQEEWYGIVSQGKGTDSPFLRYPRSAYYMLKDEWNNSEDGSR